MSNKKQKWIQDFKTGFGNALSRQPTTSLHGQLCRNLQEYEKLPKDPPSEREILGGVFPTWLNPLMP